MSQMCLMQTLVRGLIFFGDDGDPLMSDISIQTASLARAKFNRGLIWYDIMMQETGFSMYSLETNSGLGLDSFNDDVNSLMSDISIHVSSLARAEFNLDLVWSVIRVRETNFSIQYLETNFSRKALLLLIKLIYFMM